MAIGEQAVMANLMEAVRQDVEQEAAHKLTNGQAHDFGLASAVLAVILPTEPDMLVVEIDETTIADGDAMRVARQIGKNLGRPGEGTLGVDHPFDFAQGSKVGAERRRIFETDEIVEELEFAGPMQGFETFEEQAAEEPREHPHRQEEARPARNPMLAVRRDAATRHDAVHVGMMIEVLSPGVQDGGDADLYTEMPGIGRYGGECLGCGGEQQPVDLGFVLIGDRANRRR